MIDPVCSNFQASGPAGSHPPTHGLAWTNVIFLAFAHVMAVTAVLYLCVVRFEWWTLGLGLVWTILCGVSITGGYHRLFSHSAYTASPILRVLYLVFGAASVQNSAIMWAADHRAHHADTDGDGDPYNIQRGFWWAHIGWVLYRAPHSRNISLVRDLESDPLIRLQHRFYVPLAILFGAVTPGLIGLLWGDPIGAMLVAGFLRLVLQWHATFSINSLTHSLGSQPYGRQNSARDSFWAALVTLGEGYHNFHHRFQVDYRNGMRWYHFDPTKWWVWTMARIGLARSLRRVARARIDAVRRTGRDPGPSPAPVRETLGTSQPEPSWTPPLDGPTVKPSGHRRAVTGPGPGNPRGNGT